MARAWKVAPTDTVATMLDDARAGDTLTVDGAAGDAIGSVITLADDIARGHKVALLPMGIGASVLKYGFPIGHATAAIQPGAHVHSHNLSTALDATLDYRYAPTPAATLPQVEAPTFMGYRRADGRVATRNEIWVLPTVGCVARTAQRIAAGAAAQVGDAVDGVHAFTHPHGCSQLGDDLGGTRAILAGLASHPNAGGVLIVGLGCEENQVAALLDAIPAAHRGRIRTLTAQLSADEVEEGIAAVVALAEAARTERTPCPLSDLVLGVKCGGSDGLSGLTANPLVGQMSDRVVAAGGRVVFTEIPEIFGAEQTLMDRTAAPQVFDRIVGVVNGFKRYFLDHGEPVSENPSPGNVAGGITTLEEKSLGAVQKAGRARVGAVIDYGEGATQTGLTLLEAPGNDAVSSTALAAAGATAILFTTGRGTPLGFPVPTIKIASNSDLAARKHGWVDFDAGAVLDTGFEAASEALVSRIVAVASGESTAAERNGEREIAIWKRGVTL
ncbi:UxaA family hydrolase [Sphingomonas sp. S6]|jgi:altronate hydrolase|uniref:UxaA family hydrolase n=1 Tax=Sphingomonas sp. S6 TaxID=3368600 RepID=UPI000FBF13D4|nr:altronate dehydratase family protein [uncultured Sphingomonas sp.]RTL22668.1 MAG: altronate dehydratase [Sphingomonadaceae bacterium]